MASNDDRNPSRAEVFAANQQAAARELNRAIEAGWREAGRRAGMTAGTEAVSPAFAARPSVRSGWHAGGLDRDDRCRIPVSGNLPPGGENPTPESDSGGRRGPVAGGSE